MFSQNSENDRSVKSLKRVLDILLALAILLPATVIVVPAIVLIRATSAGPGLYRQRRVGRDGAIFTLLKLRTMYSDTGDLPSHNVSRAKVTPIGRWLRRTKLDELPQVYNVIRGEMSFVGPRPCLPAQTELIEERRIRGVLAARPGITGWAQVRGIDMSDPKRLATADAEYLDQRSILGDLKIVLMTFGGFGSGDAVT